MKTKIKTNTFYKNSLYIIPTPIGNMGDITYRAINILKKVNIIVAEDTRITNNLLKKFDIKKHVLISMNNFNENQKYKKIAKKIKNGLSAALVSSAGTPLINDPGYNLVKHCKEIGIKIISLPGACSLITALITSGLTTNKFCFDGYLPRNKKERYKYLKEIKKEKRTIILYESSHRILSTLKDMAEIFDENRHIVLAIEITKYWEKTYKIKCKEILTLIKKNKIKRKGEIVVLIEGYKKNKKSKIKKEIPKNILTIFDILQKYKTKKESIEIIKNNFNIKRNLLYKNSIKK
ncbi:Ribosomal RNA small subunit methyltransferase I [Buchnera aphidicola (Neophyllaphis podocarpi)]|uniref:16S rRNA (cytidine(1402)-2'-O)-methyltransferase n=1 Tax=Buchnera aphidicola TaxID=9 RepID=UPI0034645FF7